MLKAIKLRFTAPVHFGRGREELDRSELLYHSDSLKSALYSVGLGFFDMWEAEKNFFDAFRISSCFPFAKDEYFIPKAQLRREIELINIDRDQVPKRVKKIEYLEKSVFEQYVSQAEQPLKIDPDNITPDGLFVCKNRDTFINKTEKTATPISFFKSEVQQRVVLPAPESKDQESRPFYIDRIYFEKDCGLYFLADFSNQEVEQQVYTALRVLGEQGIGTDRTVGNGYFEFDPSIDVADFALNIQANSGCYLAMGLFLPTEADYQNISMPDSSWNFLKRGGYMAGSEHEVFRHLRKKSVYMFTEGSIFKSDHDLQGKYLDVAPPWDDTRMHPVWRDGKCLLIKI